MNLKALTLAAIAALCAETEGFQPPSFFNMPRPTHNQFPRGANFGDFDGPSGQFASPGFF